MKNLIASLNREEHARINNSICDAFLSLYSHDYKGRKLWWDASNNCPAFVCMNGEYKRKGIFIDKNFATVRVVIDENGDQILIFECVE